MKYRMILLAILFLLHTSCKPELDVPNLYKFAIGAAINRYSRAGRPQPELDRVIVDEIGPGDEEYYNNLLNNSRYRRYKLSFEDIEKLRTGDRYEFTEKRNTIIRISDEVFYSSKDEYIIYYQLNASGGGNFYRLHIKKNKDKFEVIENFEEAIYQE